MSKTLTDLQMSIGGNLARGLDRRTLEIIYEKLMDIENEKGGKIPVTCKIDFCLDEEGMLAYEMSIKSILPVFSKVVRLRSDGKQLKLWGTQETPAAKSPKVTDPDPPAAPPAVTKLTTRPKVKKPEGPAKPEGPQRKPPRRSAEDRIAEIVADNTALYAGGDITREQALDGGVDVDKVDGITPQTPAEEKAMATKYGAAVSDLTPEELLALDNLAD